MQENGDGGRKSKTLRKALMILDAFAEEQRDWGVRSLAEHLSMNPTSVHRLLLTFDEQ